MPDLATIYADPTYKSANEATKRAIFEKWAPQDESYVGANDATKAAIQKTFGVAPKSLITTASDGSQVEFQSDRAFNDFKTMPSRNVQDARDMGATVLPPMSRDDKIKAIPLDPARPDILSATEREAAAQFKPPAPAPSGVPGPRTGSTVKALGRAAAGLADTTLGGVVAPLVEYANYNAGRLRGVSPEQARAVAQKAGDVFAQPFGRLAGVTNTPEYKGEASQQAIQFIGENLSMGVASLARATGLPEPDVQNLVDTALLLGPKPIRQAAGKAATVATALPEAAARAIAPEIGPVPGLERKVQKAAAASTADYKAAGRIDAAHWGFANGLVQPAVQSNPTTGNRARAAIKGENSQEQNAAATEKNLVRVDELARKDLAIPDNVALTSDAPFVASRARPQVAGPYDQIAQMGVLKGDGALDAALKNLKVSPRASPPAVAASFNAQLENLRSLLETEGYKGADALGDIKNLRSEAQAAWKRNDDTAAKFSQGFANVIEDLVERNMKVPRDIDKFKAARREMAKTYAWENALNFNTGKFDPLKIAKITESEPGRYTDTLRGLGQYAGNFPNAVSTFGGPSAGTRIVRSSPSAMVGYAVGLPFGVPWLAGALGAGIGEATNALSRSGLTSAAARQRALPADRRIRPDEPYVPPVNELTSAAGKVERGERATMSATERLAWKRYNANLAAATDPTYASKFTPEDLSNRQWLMDTVNKARQKADAFDEIAKRADETQAGRDAARAAEVSRDRMLDFLDDLQTRLSVLPKRKPKSQNALRDGRSDSN